MSDPSGLDVAGLRAAAEGVDSEMGWYDENETKPEEIRTKNPEDIEFIAAADPTTVLALLDRLAVAEGAVERVRAMLADIDGAYRETSEGDGRRADIAFGLVSAVETVGRALDGPPGERGVDLTASQGAAGSQCQSGSRGAERGAL